VYACVAGYLLSLAEDAVPRCVGRVLSRDVSRCDKVTHVVETLMMNGAVLVPYPCTSCCCDVSVIMNSTTVMFVHGQVTIIFVVSVCLFVCLFVQFFSAVFDPISIKLGHMLYVWV